MAFRSALLAATMLLLPPVAGAQPVSGLYMGAGAGAGFRSAAEAGPFEARSDSPGAVALGSIGWGFGNGLRAEIEASYRSNAVDEIRVKGARMDRVGGSLRSYGAMANLLYDVNALGLAGLLTPYVGLGVGYGVSEAHRVRAYSPKGTASLRLDDEAGSFAFQGILGAAWDLGSILPGLALTTEYRFFGTVPPDLSGMVHAGPMRIPSRISPTNYNHALLVGLRYRFRVAPLPEPRPMAP